MKTKLETLTDYCKDFIIDNLPDYLGTSVYISIPSGTIKSEWVNNDIRSISKFQFLLVRLKALPEGFTFKFIRDFNSFWYD